MSLEFEKKLTAFLQSLDLPIEKFEKLYVEDFDDYKRLVEYFLISVYKLNIHQAIYFVYKSIDDIRFIEFTETHKNLYGIRISDENIDFKQIESLNQLIQIIRYIQKDSFEFFTLNRELEKLKSIEVFDLLKQGAAISDNETFMFLKNLQHSI
jgi:hypothetical protein